MAKPKKSSEPQAEGEAAPKSRKLMMIGAAVVVLAAGGGSFWWFKVRPAATKADVKKVAIFLDLPEMTVNLAQGGANERQSFLKLKVALEVADQKTLTEIQPVMPRLLDNFQVFLRELKVSDLEGSAGLYRLKEELVRRTNIAVHPAKIDAVLFKDILVQ